MVFLISKFAGSKLSSDIKDWGAFSDYLISLISVIVLIVLTFRIARLELRENKRIENLLKFCAESELNNAWLLPLTKLVKRRNYRPFFPGCKLCVYRWQEHTDFEATTCKLT